jgi:hypothetical protein
VHVVVRFDKALHLQPLIILRPDELRTQLTKLITGASLPIGRVIDGKCENGFFRLDINPVLDVW